MLPVSPELIKDVAVIAGMSDVEECANVLANSIIPNNAKPAEIATFLAIAKQYNLNPITKEIYAFPNRGGVQPIVSIDGWLKIINSHPQFNGMEYRDQLGANNELISVTCRIYRKDREHPVEVTEYMNECRRGSEPWKQCPSRMLRHKATIQAARYAFGFSGIIDQDEAERTVYVQTAPINVKPTVLASEEQINEILAMAAETQSDPNKIALAYNVQDIYSLSTDDADKVLEQLKRKKAKQQAENDEIPL
ncbi:MAG: recombinase RecT [Cardiobacteriaceae bacterium]|nr:recombinase RecT [Cardiobacteriaceae bacterium]